MRSGAIVGLKSVLPSEFANPENVEPGAGFATSAPEACCQLNPIPNPIDGSQR